MVLSDPAQRYNVCMNLVDFGMTSNDLLYVSNVLVSLSQGARL